MRELCIKLVLVKEITGFNMKKWWSMPLSVQVLEFTGNSPLCIFKIL